MFYHFGSRELTEMTRDELLESLLVKADPEDLRNFLGRELARNYKMADRFIRDMTPADASPEEKYEAFDAAIRPILGRFSYKVDEYYYNQIGFDESEVANMSEEEADEHRSHLASVFAIEESLSDAASHAFRLIEENRVEEGFEFADWADDQIDEMLESEGWELKDFENDDINDALEEVSNLCFHKESALWKHHQAALKALEKLAQEGSQRAKRILVAHQ